MKKFIFSLCSVAVASTAAAFENPAVVPDAVICGFSPDNKSAISEISSTVLFFDLNNLTAPKIFSESEDGLVGYTVGAGNFMSNSAAMILRNQQGASAWCWSPEASIVNGRWRSMNTETSSTGLGMPNAITADASRACGNMSTGSQFGQEDHTYVTPCYWDFDGTTFTRTPLTHPTTDYAGLAPQYVTALCISDNGKTIIGQIVSNNGFLCEYVVYKQADDGSWSFVKPFDDQVNPNHLKYPELPGESPATPTPESYFNTTEQAAYDAALEAYQNGQGEEPDPKNYLTSPEGIAAYNDACDAYNAWVDKYNAWKEVDNQVIMQSISFVYNLGCISPNGKFFCASSTKTYMNTQTGEIFDVYEPVLYDLEKMQQATLPSTTHSILVTGVSDNGDLVGYERDADIDFGYFLAAGASEWKPLEEYIIERNPSMAQWIEENWKHSIQVIIDEEEGISEYRDMIITGLPIMSRDFTMLSTAAYAFWSDGNPDLYNRYHSYIIYLDREASINEVNASGTVNGDSHWYNLQGIKLESAPSAPGIYIHQGRKIIVK